MGNDHNNDHYLAENDNYLKENETDPGEAEQSSRRDFLHSLGKWSKAVIGGIILGNLLPSAEANAQGAAWVNRRGGWVNAATAHTGGWVNRAGGWINGAGAGWVNRAGGWVNGHSGGSAGWVNRAGGGGAAWVNRRGY
jgi:hypothetical protein